MDFPLPRYVIFSIINAKKGATMKRKDILKKLRAAGMTIKEGGGHTKVFDAAGKYKSTVPRHNEIGELLADAIAKQTGVQLRGEK